METSEDRMLEIVDLWDSWVQETEMFDADVDSSIEDFLGWMIDQGHQPPTDGEAAWAREIADSLSETGEEEALHAVIMAWLLDEGYTSADQVD